MFGLVGLHRWMCSYVLMPRFVTFASFGRLEEAISVPLSLMQLLTMVWHLTHYPTPFSLSDHIEGKTTYSTLSTAGAYVHPCRWSLGSHL